MNMITQLVDRSMTRDAHSALTSTAAFYYDNGGEIFGLWRDVVDAFVDTHNILVSTGIKPGQMLPANAIAPTPAAIEASLKHIHARLVHCGYVLGPTEFLVCPMSYCCEMLETLSQLSGAIYSDAVNGFDNEHPINSSHLDG